ncbi:hypothetical protein CFB45_17905 [Burkholderia sp. HI2500]|nr:hypothetical protein CFB45_17905 [Burkholderia sp. HI2500]
MCFMDRALRGGSAPSGGLPAAARRDAPDGAPGLPRGASACTGRANALQSNHVGGVAAAPINLSLKRK